MIIGEFYDFQEHEAKNNHCRVNLKKRVKTVRLVSLFLVLCGAFGGHQLIVGSRKAQLWTGLAGARSSPN